MNIKDKLAKVDTDFTVTKYDNGYLFAVRGEDVNENWCDCNIMCTDSQKVLELMLEFDGMEQR